MALVRTVLMAWLLAVLSLDRTAAQSEVHASVGENVILPCTCSTITEKVVWQAGKTIVNHYKKSAEKTNEPDHPYKNRSLFLSEGIKERQCSLLLRQVTEADEKKYTCYTMDDDKSLNESHVYLKINQRRVETPTQQPPPNTVAASLSLVAIMVIILAIIIIGIMLKRRRRQRMLQENHLDPQSGLPIMDHSPV
ncbi:uncharacterized protein si:dkey-192g7.3 [Astyanax mexicanus]|uniref:uncharacterized protein si:dkey-192g7.3 n=1 Tax=Astyanax mexicanus TaxID=7994 RepID=UPI0020CB3EDA|nr:uncharacterized protein si:dkey-192g7.3 [Astyanax mexicanus]